MEKYFGRTYNATGDTNADFLIKTRGQVKVQYGNKFIDLIKDGKINVDIDFIKSVPSVDNIPKTDGFYYVEDTGILYVSIGGTLISIAGELGTTYVSFAGPQDTTIEQKLQALNNIGLIYPTMDEAVESGIQNGIVFIEDTLRFYIVEKGVFAEYPSSIPNPYTKQFVINKTETKSGSLVLMGDGIANGLFIGDGLKLYQEGMFSVINGDNIVFRTGNLDAVEFDDLKATFNIEILANKPVSGNKFQSIGATSKKGFRLYIEGGKSILEVDKIIERDSTSAFPIKEHWLSTYNIVTEVEDFENEEDVYALTFHHRSTFKVGDILAVYKYLTTIDENEDENIEIVRILMQVTEAEEENLIKVIMLRDFTRPEQEDDEYDITDIAGSVVYKVAEPIKASGIRIDKNIDLVEADSANTVDLLSSIRTRLGNIKVLNKSYPEEPILDIPEYGFYSDNALLEKANLFYSKMYKSDIHASNIYKSRIEDSDIYDSRLYNPDIYAPIFRGGENMDMFPKYEDGFEIPENDNSKTLATTEWVNKKIVSGTGNFVTLDTAQEITGEKTFSGGIIVNGVKIDAGESVGVLRLTYGGKVIELVPDGETRLDSSLHAKGGTFED